MKIVFFKTVAAFRTWLRRHHSEHRILHVGFHKRHTDQPSITWPEAVDEALCYGWIDGVRHRIDDERYTIRFTPRRSNSVWSTVNLRRARALIREKRMAAHGLRAYRERDRKKSGLYSFEQRTSVRLAPRHAKRFRANRAAWRWFRAQAPWYRRTATFWVESARLEATRERRLMTLINRSAAGRPIGPLERNRQKATLTNS